MTTEDERNLQIKFRDIINYEREDSLEVMDFNSYVDANGDGILHIATERGDVESVYILLSNNFDPNVIGDMGMTPLHIAYRCGFYEIIDLLKLYGASEDIVDQFGLKPSERVNN